MRQAAVTGPNKTGVSTSDGRVEAMQDDMDAYAPSSHGAADGAGQVRVIYARSGATVGSVPPPKGIPNLAKAGLEMLKGNDSVLLLDKLGERLAFERMGTRLYEALISKHEAWGTFEGGPSQQDLAEIMREEHRHFTLLETLIEERGGDPTAITPSADVAALMSSGIMKVVADPRTNLLQSLEAMLVAELTDKDCWMGLMELAQKFGDEELKRACVRAQEVEEKHLANVRAWVRAGQGRDRDVEAAE